MYSPAFHLTTSAQWWLTGGQVWTLPELLHAVLCTTVTVTVAVYFEPVCVCVFLSTRHSLFSLDFIACFLLVILCLVAIPTEVSASSHLLNGWQCFITHSLKSLVLQSLKPWKLELRIWKCLADILFVQTYCRRFV